MRRLRLRHRFGAVGRVGSIALLERYRRTIKAAARVRTCPPLSAASLAQRLARATAWYATCRPHTALGTATPYEITRGGPRDTPFVVAHADADRTLPVLLRRAA